MYSTVPLTFIALWIFTLGFSVVTALMEIQIEGGNGWAGCLPSWRFAPQWIRAFMNGKDLTGYHVYLNLHLIILFHFPILLAGWSWSMELTILSVFFGSIVCEDFLWFILNPHFGWDLFSPKNISWFTNWAGPLPVDYYFWIVASAVCAFLRGAVAGTTADPSFGTLSIPLQQLAGWGIGFAFCVFCIGAITFVYTPYIRKYRARDDGNHLGHPGTCIACGARMHQKNTKAERAG